MTNLMFPRLLCALILAAPVLLDAAPGDWPQWRGPQRDGLSTETGLLQAWPESGPKLLWTGRGLGAGYSSVAVAGDRIYTVGEQGEDSFVRAVSRADGKLLWSARLGRSGAPGWGGFDGPRATPATDGELVFAIGHYGEITCLAAADGRERWRKHLGETFGGERPEWGFSESPFLDGDKIVFTPGGSKGAVAALDKKTGDLLWQSHAFKDPAHYSSLIPAEIGGVRQYLQLTALSVAGLAAHDGRLLWRVARKGETAVIPTPIYADNHVFVTSSYGTGCNLFKITATGGAFKAEPVYANKNMANHHGGVVKVGPHLYGHSEGKGWVCQDIKTGEMIWNEKRKLGKGSVTFADGRLYGRAEDGPGTVALLEATPKGYAEQGRFNPPERSKKNSWAHPVVAGGRLYLRDQDVLLCYDLKAK